MAPSLKLYYFDMAGRAEPIRMILACGQVSFEDYRFPREEWAKLKAEMPFGQVPVLEVDGKKIGQSVAISRFAGKLAKLAGDNDVEDLEIDSVVDSFSDVQKKIMDMRFEKDETKKATMKEQLISETLPAICKKWDTRAGQNGGYIAHKKLTWADILFICFYESARNAVGDDIFTNYSNLLKVKQNVLSVPSLKSYLQNRKENKMLSYDLKSEV